MHSSWLTRIARPLKHQARARHRQWLIDRIIAPLPREAIVSLDQARHVVLLCSHLVRHFDPKIYVQELAFAHEMAARDRVFAVIDAPSVIFDKSVVWFLPNSLVSPRLWNYPQQAYEFAAGLEQQGNRLFCSSEEVMYWENKAFMHRKLKEIGAPTPQTTILTVENRKSVDFDIEPALVKEEHAAGSAGIHYFSTSHELRKFVMSYTFRPRESLMMQEIVRGATKDLRLTMVGDKMIRSATYWREKTHEALLNPTWTSTATTYNSLVRHGDIPEWVVPTIAGYLRTLGIRTAGIDLMWTDDDSSGNPLILELSPYYEPNPPKPHRYAHWSYKEYKAKPFVREGYIFQQYLAFRDIAAEILDQGLF
jgi:hypothetical protein